MLTTFSGEIEIDESLFGRRIKHHRGNPTGLKIWVFGMVERSSNTIIMYPVNDRSRSTLLPIIKRHVAPGSTIYSDGWSAYCDLNNEGYRHFTVVHKYTFKSFYKNVETGAVVEVHTNRIEGAWRHAKTHFRKISGTKLTQFEGHLAEVMWRSQVKANVYGPFFDLLRSVYTLQGPPTYTYARPLFDSWDVSSINEEWELIPYVSDDDVEDDDVPSQRQPRPQTPEVVPSRQSEIVITSGSQQGSIACGQVARAENQQTGTSSAISTLLREMFSDSETDQPQITTKKPPSDFVCGQVPNSRQQKAGPSTTGDCGTVQGTEKKKKLKLKLKRKSTAKDNTERGGQRVCHPKGYAPSSQGHKTRKGKGKASKPMNPYGKEAFLIWSSDSDFQ